MSDKLVRIKNRYDTANNWITENPILAAGEIGIDSTNNIIKVGNGSDSWNKLFHLNRDCEIFQAHLIKGDATSFNWDSFVIHNRPFFYNKTDGAYYHNGYATIIFLVYGDGILPQVMVKSYNNELDFRIEDSHEYVTLNIIDLLDANIDKDDCYNLVFRISIGTYQSIYDSAITIYVDPEKSTNVKFDSGDGVTDILKSVNYDIIAIC